jgi:hypothetical protein
MAHTVLGCLPEIPLSTGFARKVLKLLREPEGKKIFLTQRRQGAKKTLRNAAALCAFA